MENKNHIKRSKKLFDPIRLIFLLLIFLGLSFTTIFLSHEPAYGDDHHSGVEYKLDGVRLDAGQENLAIRGVAPAGMSGSEVCEFSNGSDDHDYFIPSKLKAGWDSVKNAGKDNNHDYIVLECCGAECFSSCITPCGEIDHGEDCTVYEYSDPCDTCESETVTCNDGQWSHNWSNTSCEITPCQNCTTYSSWSCKDSTTRERTRTCYNCSNNQCQSYTDTDTESCSTGEVCSDGVCVSDCDGEWCETYHSGMEPVCYDPDVHHCCTNNSSFDLPVLCLEPHSDLCTEEGCIECIYYEYGGDTDSGSESCTNDTIDPINGDTIDPINGDTIDPINGEDFICSCDPSGPEYDQCVDNNYCYDHETEFQCNNDPQCTAGPIEM